MAVRTAYDAVGGTVLTATNLDKYPGGWIGYAEITTSQTGISAQVDITNLSVAVTAGTSRRILAEGYCRVTQNTSTAVSEVVVFEDASSVNRSSLTLTATSNAMHQPRVIRTPSSGSRTYKLQATAGAGTVDVVASSTQPAFILVTDIGPSS